MMPARVLLVSSDLMSGRITTHALGQSSIETTLVNTAKEAIAWWADQTSDLIIIDVESPEFDAMNLIRQLRMEASIPILLLVPGNDEALAVEAYSAGVDECISKPVGPRLFLAKVNAWLARAWTVPVDLLDSFEAGNLRLDPSQRQLTTADGESVKLTNLEFRLLHLLMTHPGQVLQSNLIVDRVWGYVDEDDGTLVKNVVYRLRRKIEPDPSQPRYIQSVAGEGYMFSFD